MKRYKRLITSRENPDFKGWKKLVRSSRERRQAGLVLLEGIHLVEAWRMAYGLPKTVLVSDKGDANREIATWLATWETDALEQTRLPDALFSELADTETPTGILAFACLPEQRALPDTEQDSLLLDGVQDPGNMGAILRTAVAAGIHQALLSADCVDAWSPKVLRAGQGAHFQLNIHEGIGLPDFLERFQGDTLVATPEGGESLYAAQWRHPVAWVFGSEGQGVRPRTVAAARKHLHIPMPGAMESLNVGAAAAVCLFEMARRKLQDIAG
jgi:TrmH family RNA methyltransferase